MTDTTAADVEALRLAQTIDQATVAYVLRRTDSIVSRRLGGSTEETAARADALARALRGVSNGLEPAHAVHAACRDAVADAVRRAATDDLLSLDATTAEPGTSLADLLDADGIGTARLSHYDEAAGVWRGVARVPHPLDCLRPVEMPAPEQMQEAARDRLTDRARHILDLTIAANVAALPAHDAEWQAMLDEMAYDQNSAAWGSRHARALAIAAEIKRTKQARRDARKEATHNAYRPRTSAVAEALGITSRGRATQALADEQTAAARAYWTHRDEMAAQALEAATDRLDADAERQRDAYDARQARQGSDPLALPHVARMTTHQAIHRARQARSAAAAAAARATLQGEFLSLRLRGVHADPKQTGPGSPYTADNGAEQPAPRPRIGAPWEWTPGKPLPGPRRTIGSRLPQPTDPAADPTRSRAEALNVRCPQPAPTPRHDDHAAIAWHACDAVRLPEQPGTPQPAAHDAATVARIDAATDRASRARYDAARALKALDRAVQTATPRDAERSVEPRPCGRTRAEAEAATA